MDDKQCTTDRSKHICSMAADKKYGEIKELVADPKFMCSNCGRVSNLGKNLCSPMPFEMIGPGIPLE